MQRLSCEQVYNLWIREPNLIRIVDVRSRDAYERQQARNFNFDERLIRVFEDDNEVDSQRLGFEFCGRTLCAEGAFS